MLHLQNRCFEPFFAVFVAKEINNFESEKQLMSKQQQQSENGSKLSTLSILTNFPPCCPNPKNRKWKCINYFINQHILESGKKINLHPQFYGLYSSGRINSECRRNVFGIAAECDRIVQRPLISRNCDKTSHILITSCDFKF